jgi:DNA-binding transcriptional MerR regulator
MSYRIKTVAAMTGIQRGTLLAWERRYDLLEPERTPSGYRLYSDDDVAILKRLKSLVDAGHPIGEAVGMIRGVQGNRSTIVNDLLEGLMKFDRTAVDKVVPEIRQLTFDQAIDDVYMPLLRLVGEAWMAGQASITQEHYVSGWCREQLLAMFHALGAGPVDGPTVTCALPSDELHELGVLGIAIKLALRGWRVTWLGALLPIDELCTYVERERPRLLCVSLIRGRSEPEVLDYARELRRRAPESTLIALGGPAVATVEHFSNDSLVFAATWDALWARLPRS